MGFEVFLSMEIIHRSFYFFRNLNPQRVINYQSTPKLALAQKPWYIS